jgi:hypothetical protein
LFPDDTHNDSKPQLGITLLEENRLARWNYKVIENTPVNTPVNTIQSSIQSPIYNTVSNLQYSPQYTLQYILASLTFWWRNIPPPCTEEHSFSSLHQGLLQLFQLPMVRIHVLRSDDARSVCLLGPEVSDFWMLRTPRFNCALMISSSTAISVSENSARTCCHWVSFESLKSRSARRFFSVFRPTLSMIGHDLISSAIKGCQQESRPRVVSIWSKRFAKSPRRPASSYRPTNAGLRRRVRMNAVPLIAVMKFPAYMKPPRKVTTA